MHKKAKAITLLPLMLALLTLTVICSLALPKPEPEKPIVQEPVTQPLPVADTVIATATLTEPLPIADESEPELLQIPDIPLSFELQEVMQTACQEYGVPYSLALAVAECESDFDLEADSGICWGVMQINPCNYARLRELGIEPTEYEGNIVAGVLMLGELLDKYGDTHKALMAYNCGEYGASRLWEEGYATSRYSRIVITQSEKWQQTINSYGG